MSGNNGTDDGGFAEFEAAGDVEVGKPVIESNAADSGEAEEKPTKKSGRPPREKAPSKAAEAAAEKAKGADKTDDADEPETDGAQDDDAEEDEDEEEEQQPKPKKKASERIRELNARLRQEERLRRASDERLSAIEKSLLQSGNSSGNDAGTGKPAPDPSDTSKYPLGHLDDRYIEDKLEFLATQKAAERADAVLQRQQEGERNAALQKQREVLLEKVDDLSTRGSELFDDFQDAVVESGMRGDWRLDQPTFEAAHEAENGAQILYELSQDKKEAARVAGLSPYQQMRFVMDRDAELSSKAKPRTKPGAGAPPATQIRGANSRTRINPSTDNLDDFEKAWAADAKGK